MLYGNLSSLKEASISILYWMCATNLFVFMRFAHHELGDHGFVMGFLHLVFRGVLYGGILGFVLYILKVAFAQKKYEHIPYAKLITLQTIIYFIIILVSMFIVKLITLFNVNGVVNREQFRIEFFSLDTVAALGFFLVFAAFYNLMYQIIQKFGPSNFWRMVTGKYYSPKEEEKIFMFLDLKSSTTIAEKIGHKKYSELIQECFKDITIIGDYGGEVYQYVGDEAVFTWDARKEDSHHKSVEAFYAFQDRINGKKEQYESRFGLVPVFKAGLHGGTVMVAEVGILKKEIAFHGDTINTAARIQAMCNEKGKMFLTSDYFKGLVKNNAAFNWEDMGNIILKGRKGKTKLYHPALV